MKTYNSNDIDKIIVNLREDLKNELKNELRNEQKSKFRRFVVFAIVLCLILSGITGVASYTIVAGNVGYTAKDTSWTVDNTQDAIDELRDTVGYALVGSIFSYMGNNAPFGYLACDGTEYNISDYPRLAEHFISEFGSSNYFGGDGTTTFAVPDLRGEFLRGTGTNSHTNQGSGSNVGTHQDATEQLRIRTDTVNMWVSGRNDDEYKTNNFDSEFGTSNKLYGGSSHWGGTMIEKQYFTARPTNTSVLYIIKY